MPRDPRYFQIGALAALLIWSFVGLDGEIRLGIAGTLIAATLLTQWVAGRLAGLARFDPRSALITGLSLALLMRTDALLLAAAAGSWAIAGKFLLRWRGKHLFNPSNLGLVTFALLTDRAWISSGQWGSGMLLALAIFGLGLLVLLRARRTDITWAFLISWSPLLLGRTLWLGDPWSIPLHQLADGGFLIFAFFMISDPKSTPDSRRGRLLFAFLVAAVAYGIRFFFWEPQAIFYALALCAPTVPLLDRYLVEARYRWERPSVGAAPRPSTGNVGETLPV